MLVEERLSLLSFMLIGCFFFFFSSRRRHTRWNCDWSSDVCSSDLLQSVAVGRGFADPSGNTQSNFTATSRASLEIHAYNADGSLNFQSNDLVKVALRDRKSTRLNSSHSSISYAVFCLKKKNYKLTK